MLGKNFKARRRNMIFLHEILRECLAALNNRRFLRGPNILTLGFQTRQLCQGLREVQVQQRSGLYLGSMRNRPSLLNINGDIGAFGYHSNSGIPRRGIDFFNLFRLGKLPAYSVLSTSLSHNKYFHLNPLLNGMDNTYSSSI
jgi:hypothetical protein